MIYIPYHTPYIKKEEIGAVKEVMQDYSLGGNGPFGRRLEEIVKKYTKSRYAFFTTSCTSAIEMAILALKVSKGDEVICPSFSFVSVGNAIVKSGAKLVFVDIDEDTFNIDIELLKKAVTKETKLIIPIHYAGHSCDMEKILEIADRNGVKVIEDAAQAFGSFYNGMHLGTIGNIGCLSLHNTKNITCGEGGILLTHDTKIAKAVDIIREKGTNRSEFLKGMVHKYTWLSVGSSYVQSDILAAIAIEQFKKISWINKRREINANYLNSRLARYEPFLRLPKIIDGAKTNWHIYAIRLKTKKKRDIFISKMKEEGVECTSHFIPLHTSPFAKKYLGYKTKDYPVTEKICDTLVRIPVYPQLRGGDMRYIADKIEKVVSRIM
jgi:dTDP-4-amino-4,6-dideoxygalactose transaminase